MSKRNKKLLSLLLSTMMVFSVVPSTVYAAPEQGTEATVEQDANEEVKQEDTVNNEADASADQTDTKQDETKADDTSQKNDEAVTQTGDEATPAVDNAVTVSGTSIQIPTIQFKGANAAVAEALTKDVEIDESNPAIKGLRKELENLEIAGGEAGQEDNVSAIATYADEDDTKVEKLTQEQINTVVKQYQQYLDQWTANANILGVQNPFFLDFNDSDNSDGLGVLGEMLAMDNKSVADVREGKISYDDLTGMILTFTQGDKLGIQHYGPQVENARTEVLQAVKDSGAKTDAQKLLVINDWLAHHNTFDMAYIMNSGKKDDEKPMYSKDPETPEHYGEVQQVFDEMYRPQIQQQFHDQVYAGVENNLRQTFYEKAIQNAVYQQVLKQTAADPENPTDEEKDAATKQAESYVEQNKDAIDKDPDGYARKNFGDEAADQLKEQADKFIETAKTDGVDMGNGQKMTIEQITQNSMATDKILDTDNDGVNDKTANEAIELYTAQASSQMTDGVINYWEGSQFGALGFGKSVCLGYSKAYTYLVQCLDTDVYLKNPDAGYKSGNWKTAEELYYKDGKLNIDAGYTVDLVRITFKSSVSMFGKEDPDFGSDHYWNAVRLNGKWYYVDPCYTDVYTEVMSRDRVETDGDMNHAFFLFSDTSARKLYDGNMDTTKPGDGLRTLYRKAATDQSYEKAWVARAASNVYSDGTYMYYLYDSTDLFARADSMSNMGSSSSSSSDKKTTEYKLVRHKITDQDIVSDKDADSDYETLINFTDKGKDADGKEQNVVTVLKDGKMQKDETLTKLYEQFKDEQKIYPSIGLTAAYYSGKLYFNVSNDLMSYDLKTGEVATVKEYNTVSATRDFSKLFGGMAFTVTKDDSNAAFTVENHPISGVTIKEDGTLYVSIATNLGFISGKKNISDHESQGYEFEETDYNPNYTNYKKLQSIMGNPTNDNDEFMWSANFVETTKMSELTGDSHHFDTKSIAATCGRDAFTESRCSDCGLIEAGTRKTQEGTAHEHHYIEFNEVYYTKADNGNVNKGVNYVCPECGDCITKPVKSKLSSMMGTEDDYDERLAKYEAAAKDAKEGHAYTATDASISDDHTQITFQNLKCDSCYAKKDKLDCLLSKDTDAGNKANYDSIEKTLDEKVTADIDPKKTTSVGSCEDENGASTVYVAAGKTDAGVKYTATATVTGKKGQHTYSSTIEWSKEKNADGKYDVTVKDVKCDVCGDEPKAEQIGTPVVEKDESQSKAATCEKDGVEVWIATVEVKNADGSATIGTLTSKQEVKLDKLGHKYGEPKWNWADDNKSATATFTCANDVNKDHAKTVKAKVEEKPESASCTEPGKVTYKASVEFDGKTYEDSKPVDVPALGHDYKVSKKDGWKWTADKEKGYTAKATFVCSRCKDSHEVDATVTKEEKDGQVIYTATAKYTDESGKEFTATDVKETKLSIYYEVHRQDYGWEVDAKDEADLSKWKSDGMDSGTVGECKRLEAIKIKLPDGVSGSVQYRTHIQDIGWESKWAEDGALSGTSGKAKRLEAIQIKLSGKVADNYDIYYCVHAQNVGWLGWAKNGEQAGTAGYAYRLEAIRIKLVPKGEKPPKKVGSTDKAMEARLVGYQTHVQDIGTQDYVYDGAMAGTSGQAKRMESIRIKLPSTMASEGKIEYKSHIENIGWEKSWKKTGELSGTTGKSLRLEAIQIKLSGDIAEKYDVYYRVHAENFGWLGWAKNGEKSGTEGYAYRLEALQIKLVPKGTENPELPTPASAKKEAFIKK